MRRLLLSIILICVFAVPASAHPGDTDSSGGHYDRETGEYHYHHGYEAHSHTDLDGDGELDCPYDFDDQTGRNSGTPGSSSATRTSSNVGGDSFDRGYDLGYDAGYDYGYDRGYAAGVVNERGKHSDTSAVVPDDGSYSEGYAAGYSRARTLAFWAAGLLSAFFLLLGNHRKKKREADRRESETRYEQALDRLRAERDALAADQQRIQADCRDQIDRIQTACQARLRELVQSHDAQLAEQTRLSDGAIVTLAYAKDAEITRLTAKVEECRAALERTRAGHADELRRLEAAARATRLDCFLACFSSDELSDLDIPKDAELCGGTVSVGNVTRWKPFGDLTVYTAPSGKCYHMTRGCCGATTPNNRYELMLQSVPHCSKCGTWKDFLARCPDWYIRYKEIISGNDSEGR